MLGELPGVLKTAETESQIQSSQTSRTLSMGVDPHNEVDECQQFKTNQQSLVDDSVFPFPLDDEVSRYLASTTDRKGEMIALMDHKTLTLMSKPTHLCIIPGQRAKLIMLPKGVAPSKTQ